jgi:hypothetical protein
MQKLQGASFSGFPGAVFVILQRGWLVATLTRVIVSPCLSYLLHGLLGASFQSVQFVLLFLLFKLFNVPDQSGFGLLVYWFSVAIGVAFLGIGVFLSLPREVATTFDLDSQRVVHLVSIGRGRYERRRTYAFAEIIGLRLNGYAAEPDSYMPVMTLLNGETRWLSTANTSYLICEATIEAICAVTGLQKLGVLRQGLCIYVADR